MRRISAVTKPAVEIALELLGDFRKRFEKAEEISIFLCGGPLCQQVAQLTEIIATWDQSFAELRESMTELLESLDATLRRAKSKV